MPVYKQHRLVHIHIPKTGGTAIERQFHRLGDLVWGLESWLGEEHHDNRWYEYQHLTAVEFHELTDSQYASFATFAVVRSPYERLISDHLWRVRIHDNNSVPQILSFGSFDEFVRAIPADIDDSWSDHITGADRATANFLIHTRPQHHYVTGADDEIDRSIELLRFEKLRVDAERLFEKRNIENQVIANPGRYRIRDYFTSETIRIANDLYGRDFELFSYEKIPPTDRRFFTVPPHSTSTTAGDADDASKQTYSAPARLDDRPTKRIAILVIAALTQPVYLHYIRSYWTELIRYTNATTPHIDVFLLLENGTSMNAFSHVADNVIEDPRADLDQLCPRPSRAPGVPGILSKTIHAFDLLQGQYDVFFRTNLSSMVKLSAFDEFTHSRDEICYSGGIVWDDALRDNLVHYDHVGPQGTVESIDELDEFVGNSFVSGSGYLLSADEAKSLVEQRERLRYDLPDDVSVGLMLPRHEALDRFSLVLVPNQPVDEMVQRIRASPACHLRLQHFPLETAEALWGELRHDPVWR